MTFPESKEAQERPKPICEFCSIPETKGTSLFRQLYGIDQIITSIPIAKSMTLMQDVVPLGEGGAHVLLMPNRIGRGHYISLASTSDQEAIATSAEQTIKSFQKAFPDSPLFLFEHGPGFVEGEQIACGGCHMDHAHGHVIVLPKDTLFNPIVQMLEETFSKAGWMDIISQKHEGATPFVNIGNTTGINPYIHIAIIEKNRVATITYIQTSRSEQIESQLLRKIIAKTVYGESNPTYWHWRDITSGLTSQQRLIELKEKVSFFRSIFK